MVNHFELVRTSKSEDDYLLLGKTKFPLNQFFNSERSNELTEQESTPSILHPVIVYRIPLNANINVESKKIELCNEAVNTIVEDRRERDFMLNRFNEVI